MIFQIPHDFDPLHGQSPAWSACCQRANGEKGMQFQDSQEVRCVSIVQSRHESARLGYEANK